MIAIHHRPDSFSEKWIEYCQENNLNYKIINLFDTNLLKKLREDRISHLLFHFGVNEYKTDLILKDLSYILEKEGIKVFPNYSTYWHYDDKVKQKYLFEQLNIPHAPMHVFYSKEKALYWIRDEASYPFVFKLRRGAGSNNVKLVENKEEAKKLVNKMFGKGINAVPPVLNDLKTKVKKHNKKRDWKKTIQRLPKTLMNVYGKKQKASPEKGYFLAQDFYSENEFDTRVTVIGGSKAFAFRRLTRANDFRASGSGFIDYESRKIDVDMIKIAFNAAKKIDGLSLAFDFIYDQDQKPKIIEASYCYLSSAVYNTGGYWTRDLEYHSEQNQPEALIIKSLLSDEV